MSIKCPCGENRGTVGFVSLEFRSQVWTGDRDLQEFKVMGLGDVTQGVSVDKEEKNVIPCPSHTKYIYLGNSQVWKFIKFNSSITVFNMKVICFLRKFMLL